MPGSGDMVAIRTAGAYGEVMASSYNLRSPAKAVYSDQLNHLEKSRVQTFSKASGGY